MEELVTGPGGLLSRGLIEDDGIHYGALPRRKQKRATLAGILNEHVRVHFPEYAKFHSGAGVVRVPGFWQEPSGMVHIWKPRNYLMPLLVIPYKDANGLIQACQIRLHAKDIPLMRKDTVGSHHHSNGTALVPEHQYISLLLRTRLLQARQCLSLRVP
jgi:hypothetical protein